MKRDLEVSYHGSVSLVRPLTPTGKAWLHENVQDDALWYAGALAVEGRYLQPLLAGATADGLGVFGEDEDYPDRCVRCQENPCLCACEAEQDDDPYA